MEPPEDLELAKQPNLPPLGPQGNACKSRLRGALGRRDGVCINQGGARMDDTPPRYLPEAR